jgi:hypothetical protein
MMPWVYSKTPIFSSADQPAPTFSHSPEAFAEAADRGLALADLIALSLLLSHWWLRFTIQEEIEGKTRLSLRFFDCLAWMGPSRKVAGN